ncbi:hypothetical protein CVIRNUC_003953 [Coccomyxa viridis]|uniref:Uncharacterized protein n=1 Tax=Coccomyxa viridis TaxID=1274662 RepID=A0AAV1I4I8_9CHLO|nr:hypothetical protein CVIRNUC_003953 [Coccomyxa viridis]
MQPQEAAKNEDLTQSEDLGDVKPEWRSSRGRGRPRRSLEGAELSLQSAPSIGKRRGRPAAKGKLSVGSDSVVIKLDLQVDCTTSQSEEKKTCRRKASNPVRSALQ